MNGRGWAAGLAVIVGVFGVERLSAAEIGDPLPTNPSSPVPNPWAPRIYRGLGITLARTDADDAVDYRFTVKIVSKLIMGKGIDGRAMGVAAGTREQRGTLAYTSPTHASRTKAARSFVGRSSASWQISSTSLPSLVTRH